MHLASLSSPLPFSTLGFSILIGSGTCNFSLYSHLADLATWHSHHLATYQQHKHRDESWWRVSPLLQPSWVWKCFEICSNKSPGRQFSCLMGAPLCSCIWERIVVCKFTCTRPRCHEAPPTSQNLSLVWDAPEQKWPLGPIYLFIMKWSQFIIPFLCNVRTPQITYSLLNFSDI